ncbi:16S rRNA (adenine(1518)-N(6)/adenine(1519)-N(6))-dimethyltransferase RsmA [Entomospira entomophila]|uniref:Ribosomal RNA small subunit methyltransferase A n=1 Tax=Entomospira entomophila TaxID=2719988 RepID=A0A968GCA7_9SPIO|nr:16S rRNA (adenine(1518)-N(6)/adenine(1519)-N(6))-dimethyltransferase RsmA [Entomospira entomophilus]NIZ40988.1 ribosomal RNA small subunit methyltransferase A [Entomospira entomophilus]WDI35201.1 16S rRNA (adenine(1518)-N(6)/adenine(1519)-N(6))-dimethyltransferase RsmA [Entomospira entomophilus]
MNAPLEYDSPVHIAQFLAKAGIAPRKRWGQNFLINAGARSKIIDLLHLHPSDLLLEIGPGLGAMTHQALTMDPHKLVVFEVDPAYQRILESFFGHNSKFTLIAGDVLQTWNPFFQSHPITDTTASVKILGNLPYNISAAIIQQIAMTPCSLAVLTVQKELAERLLAKPKTKNYSSLSVWCQSNFDVSFHGTLKAGSFYPQPHVDSAIIKLTPRKTVLAVLPTLDHILKLAFSHRRKMLRHNWQSIQSGPISMLTLESIYQILEDHHIELQMRAEEITPETYLSVAKELYQLASVSNHS